MRDAGARRLGHKLGENLRGDGSRALDKRLAQVRGQLSRELPKPPRIRGNRLQNVSAKAQRVLDGMESLQDSETRIAPRRAVATDQRLITHGVATSSAAWAYAARHSATRGRRRGCGSWRRGSFWRWLGLGRRFRVFRFVAAFALVGFLFAFFEFFVFAFFFAVGTRRAGVFAVEAGELGQARGLGEFGAVAGNCRCHEGAPDWPRRRSAEPGRFARLRMAHPNRGRVSGV